MSEIDIDIAIDIDIDDESLPTRKYAAHRHDAVNRGKSLTPEHGLPKSRNNFSSHKKRPQDRSAAQAVCPA